MTKWGWIVFWMLSAGGALAQSFSPVFRHYSVNDGLPSTEVYNVVQDQRGFLWFSTDRGLSRFDGETFKNYSLSDGLPEVAVYRLYDDAKGRIWGTTSTNRLFYVYRDTIHLYQYNDVLATVVENGEVPRTLAVDKDDNMHIGYIEKGYIYISADGVLEERCVGSRENNDVYIRQVDDRVVYYRCALKEVNAMEMTGIFEGEATTHTIGIGPVQFSTPKLRNGLYSNQGNLYALLDHRAVKFSPNGEVITHTIDKGAYNLSETEDYIWIGYGANGVEAFRDAHFPRVERHLLDGNSVTSVLIDHEGGYWFTTANDGVFYTPGLDIRSTTFDLGGSIAVSQVQKIRDKYYVLLATGEIRVVDENWQITELEIPLKSKYIFSGMHYDKEQKRLVLGTRGAAPGIVSFEDGATAADHRMGNNFIRYIADTIRDRVITLNASGVIIEQNDEEYMIYRRRPRDIAMTDDGRIYLASFGGLRVLEGMEFRSPDTLNSLLNIRTEALAVDGDRLFLGTMGLGLVEYDGEKVVQQITETDGLPSNVVQALHLYGNTLWVGTNKGVCKVDFMENETVVSVMSRTDGLIWDEITSLQQEGDQLWVGTRNGLSVIPVQYFKQKHAKPLLHYGGYSLDGNYFPPATEVVLHPDQSDLQFHLSILSFVSPGEVLFRYRLNNGEWLYTKVRDIKFLELAAGEYTLEVQKLNVNQGWEQALEPIVITVEQPFYKSTWFLLLVNGLVLILIVWLFYRRTKRMKRRARELEDLRTHKLRALSAQMNPHFLFNSLNAIQDVLLNQDKESASRYLTRFSRLMRNVLNQSNQKFIPVHEELSSLKLYLELESLRFDHEFTWELVLDESVPGDVLIPAFLLQPYVENSIWHGLRMKEDGTKKLSVRIDIHHNKLRCIIEDNGIGREKAAQYSDAEHQSHATEITRKRLALLEENLGAEHQVQMHDLVHANGEAAGTKVELILPIRKA